MENNEKEINLLSIQVLTTIIYIGSLVISIYLTLDDKYNLQHRKRFFTKKQARNLSIFNRFLVVILTLSFLYISYENLKLSKEKGGDVSANRLQLTASELSTLATLIVLYVVIKTSGEEYSIISGIGNPNL